MKNLNKLVAIIILAIILSTGLIGCKTSLDKIQDNLNSDNYSNALSQMKRIKKDEDKVKLLDILNEKVQKIKEQFVNGQIDGTLAISNLQKFRNIKGMEETVSNNIKEINTSMDSQKGFADGQRGENEQDYATAFEGYSNVIQSDTEHYAIAQAKVKELRSIVEASQLANIEKTKILTNSTSNKKMYPDQVQVIMRNKSGKTIKKLTIGILGYDLNGNILELQTPQNGYNGYEFIGVGEDLNITSGGTWGEQYGWNIANNNIKTILACIKTLEFTDGSTWENPLYSMWLKEHNQ